MPIANQMTAEGIVSHMTTQIQDTGIFLQQTLEMLCCCRQTTPLEQVPHIDSIIGFHQTLRVTSAHCNGGG
jgi:hypothetical protein